MWLILGLGNPGFRYSENRHNAGFRVVKLAASRWSVPLGREQAGAEIGDGRFHDERVLLAMPQRYMNCSGQPGESLRSWYKIPLDHVVVVHDDMDLPFGQVRVKVGGGHGGHNGLRDLDQFMGAEFNRVRLGISRPPPEWNAADYVLSNWTAEESALLGATLENAVDALETLLSLGVPAAMNRFNTRPRTRKEPRSVGAGEAKPAKAETPRPDSLSTVTDQASKA